MATALALEFDYPGWAEPLLEPARYKGAVGGRARGASHCFATLAVETMACDPDLRFVCIREVQRALRYSAKSLVESKIRRYGLEWGPNNPDGLFEILNTEIRRRNGAGVMIFEGMQDHTADSIKSLEGFGRAWVEEAQTLSERSLRLLRPTITRVAGSELWFSWNRESPDDEVDKFFGQRIGNSNTVCVEATYQDNPFLDAEMLQEAEDDRLADPDMYEHVWGGGYFLGGAGRVYSNFKNRPHPEGNLEEGLEDTGAEILVGMDFNVNPMSAVIAVRAVDECHVLDAIEVQTSNTEEMAGELKRRYPDRRVIVCPDPSGNQRRTSAPVGQTDFTILERHGFEVRASPSAIPVVDRVNNTQNMLYQADRRRVLIHPNAKPLIKSLAYQSYKKSRDGTGTSVPDKSGGLDHMADALGYLLWQEFNVLQAPTRGARILSPWG